MKRLNDIYESILNETIKVRTIAYHGSTVKFNKFSDEFVGGEEANDQEGPGVYFSTTEEGSSYYGGLTYKVELSGKFLDDKTSSNHVSVNKVLKLIKMASDWQDTAQNWDENPRRGVIKAANDCIQYNQNEKDVFLQVWIDFYRDNPVDFVRNMVKIGYDGIIIDFNDTSNHIIVYNLNSIKLIDITK